MEKKFALITKFFTKLRGGSQPILVQASDGLLYVAKFSNNLQGPNLLFNESIGTELCRACNLPVPFWRPLLITDEFLDQNQSCWIETPEGRLRPSTGLCFGSRFLGEEGRRVLEILSRTSFNRVRNNETFWLAWLIDICACHADSRQALFLVDAQGWLSPYFVDHGHMFGGADGKKRPHFQTSRYLDSRIYHRVSARYLGNLLEVAASLPADRLWRNVSALPEEWKTASALEGLAHCLDRLSTPQLLHNILDTMVEAMANSQQRANESEQSENHGGRQLPPVLCPGVQTVRMGWPNTGFVAGYPACA